MPTKVKALEATNSDYDSFHRVVIERRDLRSDDVAIDIKYTGICHSDIFQVDRGTDKNFPIIPGHEITGVVSAVGEGVMNLKVGDRVGVGCFVNSCGECDYCKRGQEQFCRKGVVLVFNSTDYDGARTYGGYSQSIIVKEHFAVKIPDGLTLKEAAPLLCAGVTTYNPMKKWHVGPDSNVAVIGLGGLGHIAVQFAHALGAKVTVLGHSEKKRDEAGRFGADKYYLNTEDEMFSELAGQFDFILNTVAVSLDVDKYLGLLKNDGVLCYVGITDEPQSFNIFSLFGNEGIITASNVGGIPITEEMLNFAAEHDVRPQIETIGIDEVPEAYRRIMASDVRYRFVIDMSTLD